MKALSKRQQEVLDFIRDELDRGVAPSIREIAQHFGFRSTRAVCDHLQALEAKNRIRRSKGRSRSIQVLGREAGAFSGLLNIPIFGRISAGAAVMTEEQCEGHVRLASESIGFKPDGELFALIVHGDSMVQRGVLDGDTVIIDRGKKARHGDMVAALIDNECTLKTLVLANQKPYLKPENDHPRYQELHPVEQLEIQGVGRLVIRSLS